MAEYKQNYPLPDWLYGALPFIYVFIGTFVLLKIENNLGMFSGAMLVMTGLFVFKMRQAARPAVRDRKVGNDNVKTLEVATGASGSIQLVWRRAYECGNSGIDAQHKGLFEVGNDLIEAIYSRRLQSDVTALIDVLLAHVEAHFASEETLLATWDHPLTEEHKQAHQHLLKKAVKMRDKSIKGELSFPDVLSFFVKDLVLKHILEDDKKFFHQV
ncbi:MAG: hemerythrin family protein [Gammaproteobacteria bacterium]|nr:hemerythrin family protein [Gammaproteobacteria bacterium]